jgi:hypothetical protein
MYEARAANASQPYANTAFSRPDHPCYDGLKAERTEVNSTGRDAIRPASTGPGGACLNNAA